MTVLKVEKFNDSKKSIQVILNNHIKDLEIFWDYKIKYKPLLFLLKSRSEIDYIREQKTDKKLVAWFWREKFLFILEPEKFESESVFQKKDFQKILKHELSHFFFLQATGGTLPSWINEGLACYLAGQKYQEVIDVDKVGRLISCHYQFDRSLFSYSYLLVDKLINYKGKNNFINFVKSFKKNINEKEFKILFKKFFQIDFNKKNIYQLLTK
ncbi:MAG: hypothetical protein PF488_01000 [Patescibacteria group bacterium]|jgi:hypothetical protein|nr:hypothetical protein [Patescibacteria group bacterium]